MHFICAAEASSRSLHTLKPADFERLSANRPRIICLPIRLDTAGESFGSVQSSIAC